MAVEHYPLNFDELNKGDVIPIQDLERITCEHRDTSKFALKVLALREEICRQLARRGLIVTIATRKGNLHILNDADAADYNRRAFNSEWAGAARAHVRNIAVDVTKIPEDDRPKHDRALEIQGKVLQAATNARRQLTLEPTQRQTPGIQSS